MAIPTWRNSGTGVVITTGGAGVSMAAAGGNVGDGVLLQVMQDGTGTDATLSAIDGNIQNLAGTGGAITTIGTFDVGSPAAAKQLLWIGRCNNTSGLTLQVNTSGDDLYCQFHRFNDMSTGTTLATVIENSTAGSTANGTGTSTTVSDTAVTTLGADRLALNCVGINDDATGIAAFTGASGGTWAMPASFESSTGTDGTVALMTAAMASVGTIDGGSDSITIDGWGVVGFALIGTTVESQPATVAWLIA